MRKVLPFLFAGALMASAASQQTFTGVITDSMCVKDHSMMKVTPDSKCVRECVKHGAKYQLYDGKRAYLLSDQKTPEQFAGQRVKITGSLNAKTNIIKVDAISPDGQAGQAMPGMGGAHSGHKH